MSKLSKLPFTNANSAVQAAYAQVSAVQHLPAHEQVAGAALLLNVMSKNANVSVSELLNQAGRMEHDADTFFQREVKALRDYVAGELR
jgi:hypothetical protein